MQITADQHTRIQWDMAMIEAQSLKLSYSWLRDRDKREQQQQTRHGGKRPGSGRQALDPLGTIVTTIRLTGEQKAAFDMLGGKEWLRQQLDSVIGINNTK